MITAEILNVDKVISMFERLPEDAKSSMGRAVLRLAVMLQNYVKEDELSGQALHVRTGRLRMSITAKTENDGHKFTGMVGTNVEYAALNEFGGTTKAHRIEPRNGKALCFARAGFIGPLPNLKTKSGRYSSSKKGRAMLKAGINEGSLQFARGVNHPGSKIPARSFLRSAMRVLTPDLRDGLVQAIREALK